MANFFAMNFFYNRNMKLTSNLDLQRKHNKKLTSKNKAAQSQAKKLFNTFLKLALKGWAALFDAFFLLGGTCHILYFY